MEKRIWLQWERAKKGAAQLRQSRRESVECDLDMMFGGRGYTMEEKFYADKISCSDYALYESVANRQHPFSREKE